MQVTILMNLEDGGSEMVQKKMNFAKTQLMGPGYNMYDLGNLNIMKQKTVTASG
jgi:hypothetical protein